MTRNRSSRLRAARVARTSAVVVLLALAGGCGSDGSGGGGKEARSTVTALPACASAASSRSLPARFPDSFPLPDGAVVRKALDDGRTMTIVALVPGDIRAVADSLLEDLPGAGYDLGEGDSEEHEAEAHFDGDGFAGFFKLNTIAGCEGANTLAVVLTNS
jgi:hypothetical protein